MGEADWGSAEVWPMFLSHSSLRAAGLAAFSQRGTWASVAVSPSLSWPVYHPSTKTIYSPCKQLKQYRRFQLLGWNRLESLSPFKQINQQTKYVTQWFPAVGQRQHRTRVPEKRKHGQMKWDLGTDPLGHQEGQGKPHGPASPLTGGGRLGNLGGKGYAEFSGWSTGKKTASLRMENGMERRKMLRESSRHVQRVPALVSWACRDEHTYVRKLPKADKRNRQS